MQHFPVFLNLAGRLAVVVGGGAVAERKVSLLAKAGARIRVVSPEFARSLEALASEGGIEALSEPFAPSHLDGAAVVVAATGDRSVNAQVSRYARLRNVPVNVVDDPDLCTFIVPAVIDRSPVTVAVSTAGLSPSLAGWIRRRIEAALPARLGRLAEIAGRRRKTVRSLLPDAATRRRIWLKAFDGPVAERVFAGHDAEAEAGLDDLIDTARAGRRVGQVALVGAGPGDPDLLTVKALRLIQSADVVVHDRLVPMEIVERARRDAELIDVGKRPGRHAMPQEDINALLVRLALEGKDVVRLKGGDPFVFGRGGEEMEALRGAGVPVQVVPGITAATGCAASTGIPLTHRDHAQHCVLVTGHGKDGDPDLNWGALALPGQTLAIYMGLGKVPALTRNLMAHGLDPATPAAVIEKGTTAEERVIIGTLSDLAARVEAASLSGPALIVVGSVVSLARSPAALAQSFAYAV